MAKSYNGRIAELARIAEGDCQVTYADTGFIAPRYWISRDLIIDFQLRGLIERKEDRVFVTAKGKKVLAGEK